MVSRVPCGWAVPGTSGCRAFPPSQPGRRPRAGGTAGRGSQLATGGWTLRKDCSQCYYLAVFRVAGAGHGLADVVPHAVAQVDILILEGAEVDGQGEIEEVLHGLLHLQVSGGLGVGVVGWQVGGGQASYSTYWLAWGWEGGRGGDTSTAKYKNI